MALWGVWRCRRARRVRTVASWARVATLWPIEIRFSRVAAMLSVSVCSLLVGALSAPIAEAGYEWLGATHGKFAFPGEEGGLGADSGVAVNYSTGDVYVADGFNHRVTRFAPKGEFLEAWGWAVANESPRTKAFQRCGPDGEPSHPNCGSNGEAPLVVGEVDGAFEVPGDIAVDQSTGDVYVLDVARSKNVVQVFGANGEFISGFGELGAHKEFVSEGPERIQNPSGIAVDPLGNVYVSATPGPGAAYEKEGRIMIFKPETAGNYEHYAYTGTAHDIPVGQETGGVALDSSGNLYTVAGSSRVFRFAPLNLAGLTWAPTPECLSKSYADVAGLTVNPGTGEVFIYSNGAKLFYRLNSSACAQSKTISESEAFQAAAGENEVKRLALSPGVGLEAEGGGLRPAGTLYALDPNTPLNAGVIFGQSAVFPPAVVSEGASNVGVDFATLEAEVDPHGNATHYIFQYSTENTKECSVSHTCIEVPIDGGGNLEASEKEFSATATVGLAPDTTYHFRVVASSHCNPEVPADVCEATGEDSVFKTFASGASGLPDGRAYELVSPPLKDGGEVFPASPFAVNCEECLPGIDVTHSPMQSAPDGDSIIYEGQAFSATGDAVNANEYLAARTGAGGWGPESSHLSPALEGDGDAQGYKAVSPDLAHSVLYQIAPGLSSEALKSNGVAYANLYLQNTTEPANLTPLLTPSSVRVTPHREAGLGADKLELGFAGASSDFSHIIFEANDALTPEAPEGSNLYEWFDGQLRLINVLPNGTPEAGAMFGAGSEYATPDFDYSHAISADGSRIFWTAGNGRVYVHENGETVKIPDPGKFLTASSNGSKALLSDGELYDLESETLTDLTDKHGGFQGILGTSEDLSKIYFIDTAELSGKAKAGEFNLYLWQEGVTVFIATLTSADNSTFISGFINNTGDWLASPSDRTAQVSPDGRYLAFMAREDLTGYDDEVANGECGTGRGKDCFEVFAYDATTNKLSCASCNPTGERPLGSSMLSVIRTGSGSLPQPASVSTDGRVFFNSFDTLSPQDKNGVENVYEYEPKGVGTCTQAGGCVFLISSGTGETDSSFVNATPSGSDVFFTTRSQLAPQDKDDLMDLYDAREPHVPGEQVIFSSEPPPRECASGEECRAPVSSPPPNLGAPLSATLTGAGNLAPPPPPPVVKPPPVPTRAQLLAKALKACQKQHSRKSRAACAARARKRYATKAEIKVAASEGSRRGTRTAKK